MMQYEIRVFSPTRNENEFAADVYLDGKRVSCGKGGISAFSAVADALKWIKTHDVPTLVHTGHVDGQSDVIVEQHDDGSFDVTCGMKKLTKTEYTKAAEFYGLIMFSNLAAAGLFKNGK